MSIQLDTSPQKIGFFGGSFDPFHLGHLAFAVEMLEKLSLDEIWICPTSLSPFKTSYPPVEIKHRLAMIKSAVESIDQLKVIDDEAHTQKVSYTYETLLALQKKHPKKLFSLLLSDDLLANLHQWHNIQEILHQFPVYVGMYQDKDIDSMGLTPEILQKIFDHLVPIRCFEVSSKEVRERVKKRLLCSHLLPPKVLDYICNCGLYS